MVPPRHELDGGVVFEEVVLAQLPEDLVFVDETVKGGQLTLPYHTIATDGYVVLPFLLFCADLKLINPCDFHVKELLAL